MTRRADGRWAASLCVHRGTCTMHCMATQKRRVIYMSDEDWTEAAQQAGSRTISAYVRQLVDAQRRVPRLMVYGPASDLRVAEITDPRASMTQAERDAILRKINKGG